VIIGLSGGHADERAAEHWLRAVGVPLGVRHACTHLVRTPYPHVAVSLALPDDLDRGLLPAVPAELRPAADAAAAAHTTRGSGRSVFFAGIERLVGVVTVATVLAESEIEEVRVLDGAAPGPDTELLTRDFVRPHWVDGRLTLLTTTVTGGRIAPFEVPHPTPCCADH
jgi:hypothetical protein